MKNQTIFRDVLYRDPALESSLHDKKQLLLSAMEIQGKQDGVQSRPKTLNEYKAHALLQIEAGIQSCVDFVQQAYQPVSGIGKAKIIEQEANKREVEVRNALHDDERKLQTAERAANDLKPDIKLMRIRTWVLLGLSCVAMFEGWSSYTPFRYANFPTLLAFFAAIGVAFGVGLASHHAGGWIKESKTKIQTVSRYCVSLIPAIIGFAYLGYLRAHALNRTSKLEVNAHAHAGQSHPAASAFAITIISILLFLIALYISKLFYRTRNERLQEEAYESKRKEVAGLRKSVAEKEALIVHIRQDKNEQIALAFAKYEYAMAQERLLISFAFELAETYKQQNLRNRTDGMCPDCFCHRPQFDFTTFFNNSQIEHYEKA